MNAARTLDPAKSSRLTRAIIRRTRAQAHRPLTRLMSPSDFGEILKPFVFLDLFDHEGAPFNGPLHPHSGIATLRWKGITTVSSNLTKKGRDIPKMSAAR